MARRACQISCCSVGLLRSDFHGELNRNVSLNVAVLPQCLTGFLQRNCHGACQKPNHTRMFLALHKKICFLFLLNIKAGNLLPVSKRSKKEHKLFKDKIIAKNLLDNRANSLLTSRNHPVFHSASSGYCLAKSFGFGGLFKLFL